MGIIFLGHFETFWIVTGSSQASSHFNLLLCQMLVMSVTAGLAHCCCTIAENSAQVHTCTAPLRLWLNRSIQKQSEEGRLQAEFQLDGHPIVVHRQLCVSSSIVARHVVDSV